MTEDRGQMTDDRPRTTGHGAPAVDLRPLVVWDVDDVLNHLMPEWFMAFKIEHHIESVYEDLIQNPPHDILDISKKEYLQSLDTFRSEKYIELAPNIEVLNWFEKHGHAFRHAVLTAVPVKYASLSAAWVMKNFGKWIRSYHFVPSRREDDNMPEYDTSKKECLSRLGKVEVFIDDNQDNIQDASELGIKTSLFPAPWNHNRNKSIQTAIKEIIKG